MGTPEFAVPSLEALHKHGYIVPLVVTQPDRPKGRGRKATPPPVKATAARLGMAILQPESVKTENFLQMASALKPDLFVVVAFGHILSPALLDIPRLGVINLHASLLPKYRGAAPIQWAIINNEQETGVTAMQMDTGLDTGDILLATRVHIHPEDTAAMLHDRLALVGADLLIHTLSALEKGELKPKAQDHTQASQAPLLKKQDGHIDWQLPATRLEAFIRGMNPWPGAFTFRKKQRLKIFRAKALPIDTDAEPGIVIKRFSNQLCVAAGHGVLSILELQGASGKRLEVKEFLRGHPITPGTVLN